MHRMVFAISTALISLLTFGSAAEDKLNILGTLLRGKEIKGKRELAESTRWTGLPSVATSLAFSPDEQTLAMGLKDTLQFADVTSHAVTKTVEFKAGQIRALAYSGDGKQLAAGGYQNVTLFDLGTGNAIRTFKGHRGYVTGVAFSPDGQRMATACEDEVARIWNLSNDAAPMTLQGHGLPVTGIAWSPDGNTIATSAGDDTRPTKAGQVRIWDATSGMLKQQWELHQKAATGVAFSPDGRRLLSSSVDENINVYNLEDNKPVGFFSGHSRPTNAVVVYPGSEYAVSISGGRAVGKNELMAWEIATGEPVAITEAHGGKPVSLAISRSGRWAATGGQDKSVALWDISFLSTDVTNDKPKESKPESPAVALNAADVLAPANAQAEQEPATKTLRIGIIGLDTSHAPAFTKTLNANPPVAGAEGVRIVAAYPKGSPDIESSVSRVPGYTEELKKLGVEIVDSIDDLLTKVDAVLLETNDGRPHFEQALPCMKAGKPLFIDKPIAGTLVDAIAIFEAAKKYKVPVFSSSSLRFGKTSLAVRGGSLGTVFQCETSSPASLEPHHPDLFWYGIHGVESLFTVMGKGCISATRGTTPDGKIQVTGKWGGNRFGVYSEGKGYSGKAVGEKGESPVGSYDGYDPLALEIVKFLRTGQPPVSEEETLEIYAFMEAADESKRQGGASVLLETVMSKARTEAAKKIAELK